MIKQLLIVTCLASLCATLLGQATLQRRNAVSDYVLGPGDEIELHVADMDELPNAPIRIDPSGYVDLPLAGRLQLAGLTLEQAKAQLSTRFSKFITKPDLSLNLSVSGSQPVSVIGEVNNPGVHQLTGSRRLLEVLSLSGGLKSDAGPRVLVTRAQRWGKIDAPGAIVEPNGYSTVTLPLDSLLTAQAPEDNIVLLPDDVVSVPRADLVYVLGDVHKAGGFALSTHPTVSLLQALSLAEGLAPDNAAKHSRILRQVPGGDGTPREIPVDVDRIVSGKDPDVQLAANDVLFIPHSGAKVAARRAMEAAIGVSTGILIYR